MKIRKTTMEGICEVCQSLLKAKVPLEIYSLGRSGFNVFCGDIPEKMRDLMDGGVKIDAYYRLPKSEALAEKIRQLGLERMNVWCVKGKDLAERFFCVIDGKSYICDQVFSEDRMRQLREAYPLLSDEEIKSIENRFFELGEEPGKMSVFRAFINKARHCASKAL